jgi:hypothetical protein
MSNNDLLYNVRTGRCSAQSCAVLNARLQQLEPEGLNPDQKRLLRMVERRAQEVHEVQADRERFSPAKLRPLLAMFANGFVGMHDALAAIANVPVEVSKRGERAKAILDTLFVDGTAFVQLDAESAWAEGNRRLLRIKAEKLDVAIDELIGEDFLKAAEHATAKLASAIGTGRSRALPSSTALSEALQRFARAVSAYGRGLAGTVDEDDPKSVERFMKAMAPVEQHRAAQGRGGSNEDDEEPTDTTVVTTTPSVVGAPAPTTLNGTPSPVVATPAPAPTTLNGAPSPLPLVA